MVRGLEKKDEAALREMLVAFCRELDPQGDIFAPNAADNLASLYVNAPESKIVARVFIQDDAPIAFLLGRVEDRPLRRANRILFMDAGFTRPEHRERGAMAALFTDLLEGAREKNLLQLELATPLNNTVARKYWRDHGFQESMVTMHRDT